MNAGQMDERAYVDAMGERILMLFMLALVTVLAAGVAWNIVNKPFDPKVQTREMVGVDIGTARMCTAGAGCVER